MIKKCIICEKEFDGHFNAKVCSSECKRLNTNRHNAAWKKRNREQTNAIQQAYRLNNKHVRDREKEYRDNNKEKAAKRAKKLYAKPEFRRRQTDLRLQREYGITINDYEKIFEEQGGCCAICGIHQSELKKSLDIDHCHTSGKVRGLLCNKCNQGLGLFQEERDFLASAISYLQQDY